ncbi:MAG: hypothetical protein KAZ88_08905 [Acidimicrobiia bacterium]|jgi:hypothetical protein|nr:hypothetical protein [Acidimicrobiia bacterium]MBP8181096.1 hypothetical protein [Acidimicrobiia bacterium]
MLAALSVTNLVIALGVVVVLGAVLWLLDHRTADSEDDSGALEMTDSIPVPRWFEDRR